MRQNVQPEKLYELEDDSPKDADGGGAVHLEKAHDQV